MITKFLQIIQDSLDDAQQRVIGEEKPSVEQLISEKRSEWSSAGYPPGLIDRATAWALNIAKGWVKRFPPEVREERLIEILPSFLEEAKSKFMTSILKAIHGEDKKEIP